MIPHDPAQVARLLLSRHNCTLVKCTPIQRLWAGYGSICAITAQANDDDAAKYASRICDPNSLAKGQAKAGAEFKLILKLITAPESSSAGLGLDEGHLRKMFSYEVERYFYECIVPELDGLGVAGCFALTGGENRNKSQDVPRNSNEEGEDSADRLDGCMAILMADLRNLFPVSGEKRSVLSSVQVFGALEWLARFHSRSWELGIGLGSIPTSSESRPGPGSGVDGEQGLGFILPPLEEHARRIKQKQKHEGGDIGQNVWLNGGYTYLSTRRKEYTSLAEDDSEWSSAFCDPFSNSPTSITGTSSMSTAEAAALCLTPRGRIMESLIHGDVKSENLFTSRSGEDVAFFDFQYVGLGLGVCDLAKLFTCSVSVEMLLGSDFQGYLPDSLSICTGEKELLERYHRSLLRSPQSRSRSQEGKGIYDWDTFLRHWETALVDWCRFQASWGFWGNTEWLEARVRSILNDQGWRNWLEDDIEKYKV
ncbi:hypothetical protein PENSTE_c001G04649 [Penicillium steckii]|uniref:Aminoglycoside phosphotransferase domain-containing protein n=1 Tax=Penicillium steckii TaxID=303698 RepID=A0A1V6U1Z3_9EURO|nr:hypothetical protein PENSTE_c001G04649 [Penicillium steckii]